MLGHRELSIEDYVAILRRRLWVIVIPTILAPVAAYLVSLKVPSRYTSQTFVLVEQQKIPENVVRPMVTDELNERLATMKEQILSRARLQPIIERFSLFREEVGRVAMEDLVDRLRRSITVTPVRPVVESRTAGPPGFYISFTGNNARLAQQVCAEITSMFVSENLRVREQRVQGTLDFLQKQVEEAKRKLDEQDARLAAFKRRYLGQLPDQAQTNLNLLMGYNTQLEAVSLSLNRAQQDKTYTESMLAQQISAWQASQTGNNPQTLDQQLASLQNLLVILESRYTSDHPDVIKVKSDIAQLKKKIEEGAAAAGDKAGQRNQRTLLAEPVQIQQLRNQLHQYEQIIREKTVEQDKLQEQIKLSQARVQLSPTIEQEYKEVTRDYQTALNFYNDLLAKKNQSEMATDLERRQQGEQFRVMDPANLPEKPSSPDRSLFALGGLGGGLALGVGVALLLEMHDKSIRTERDVKFYLQLPTLALVPVVGNGSGQTNHLEKHPREKGEAPATPRAEA